MSHADASAAQDRTYMAWQRTAFALAVLATLSIKLTLYTHDTIGLIATIGALIGAVCMYVFARLRFSVMRGPYVLLVISATTVLLLSGVAMLQDI